ncbi:MAG: peptide-methionine (R)-S-oxide reductase MsrB, partial [Acinetobacter sp.]
MGKVNKTDREWQRELSPEEYRITRQKGTEPAFTGQYWNNKQHGTYVCRCCGAELFSSETKYDSGCGWPSFYRAIDGVAIEEHEDLSHGMVRTEIVCH